MESVPSAITVWDHTREMLLTGKQGRGFLGRLLLSKVADFQEETDTIV